MNRRRDPARPWQPRWAPALAWLLLSIATGPAVGWLVGDRSIRPVDPGPDAEPMLGAWAGLENAVGMLLAAAAIGAAATLIVLSVRGELRSGWGVLAASTAGLAGATGVAYRVWAARVGGANIGGGLLMMAFPAVIALAVLLAVGATHEIRGSSWPAAAVTVGCGALLAIGSLAVAAEAGGQLDGGDAAGLRYTLLAYTFPAMVAVPDREQAASVLMLVLAGTAQWMLFSLVCAGVLAALDRPEPLPDRM